MLPAVSKVVAVGTGVYAYLNIVAEQSKSLSLITVVEVRKGRWWTHIALLVLPSHH
jgi:hypothetical protein